MNNQMNSLISEILHMIDEHYNDELKSYRFRSADAEEEIWTMIDEFKDELDSLITESNFQIECTLNDNIIVQPDRDIIELDKYRI